MSHDDQIIDDYLDDRLSPEQRRAFERRLQDDPQLARSVASLRAVGDQLRGSTPDDALDDDFYRRARGRFVGGRRDRPVRGLRLLSWESAGLATAAMLALLLFVPPLVNRDLEPLATAESSHSQAAADAEPGLRLDDAPTVIEKVESRTADRSFGKRRERVADAGKADDVERQAAPPPPAPKPMPARPKRTPPPSGRAVAAADEREQLLQRGFTLAPGVIETESSSVVRPVEIDPALIGTDSLRVVADLVEWRALQARPEGTSLTRLGPPMASGRLVLVASPWPVTGCDALHVTADADGWQLRFDRPAADSTARRCSCATLVLADDRPVRLDD